MLQFTVKTISNIELEEICQKLVAEFMYLKHKLMLSFANPIHFYSAAYFRGPISRKISASPDLS